MIEHKSVYENGIRPLIEQVTILCTENDIPMFCTVQDTPDTFRTTCVNEEYSQFEKIKLMWMAHQSWSTDEFLKILLKDARENGHDSIFLKAIGIPNIPHT
jgi:hypothetical protein